MSNLPGPTSCTSSSSSVVLVPSSPRSDDVASGLSRTSSSSSSSSVVLVPSSPRSEEVASGVEVNSGPSQSEFIYLEKSLKTVKIMINEDISNPYKHLNEVKKLLIAVKDNPNEFFSNEKNLELLRDLFDKILKELKNF